MLIEKCLTDMEVFETDLDGVISEVFFSKIDINGYKKIYVFAKLFDRLYYLGRVPYNQYETVQALLLLIEKNSIYFKVKCLLNGGRYYEVTGADGISSKVLKRGVRDYKLTLGFYKK